MRPIESERIGHGVPILLACVFVVMVGFGITMPVLPFYTERMVAAEGSRRLSVAMHVSLLTSTYALMQLLFAPIWGRWSDKIGRRRLALIGIAGSALTQVLFGIANSLWLLHAARVLGGALSSAVFPAASAYVADVTTAAGRSRGMAWLGTAANLGVVAGLAVGGSLSRRDLHFRFRHGHLMVDSFSVPFFAAAMLMLLTLMAAFLWLPESVRADSARSSGQMTPSWRNLVQKLKPLLALTVAGQLGLAVFEATFALYAQRKLAYGPAEVGIAFSVCALVMAVFQIVATGVLSRYVRQSAQINGGFVLMGTSVMLLLLPRSMALILAIIALFALGMAFITPNLSASISTWGDPYTGTALGMQNAANSLGQVSGPLLGAALLNWNSSAPYLFAGVLLLSAGVVAAAKLPISLPCDANALSAK
jgi:DHA1 family multidrug resistance protein-like MFS transporter